MGQGVDPFGVVPDSGGTLDLQGSRQKAFDLKASYYVMKPCTNTAYILLLYMYYFEGFFAIPWRSQLTELFLDTSCRQQVTV